MIRTHSSEIGLQTNFFRFLFPLSDKQYFLKIGLVLEVGIDLKGRTATIKHADSVASECQ